jgi:hypothetical protein
MSFTIADDVGSITANRLLKKYKTLRVLGNSYISHITSSQGELFKFVMFRGNFINSFALDLYKNIVAKYPVINDNNRKQINIELDNAIKLANDNLPMENKQKESTHANV